MNLYCALDKSNVKIFSIMARPPCVVSLQIKVQLIYLRLQSQLFSSDIQTLLTCNIRLAFDGIVTKEKKTFIADPRKNER